MADDPTFQSETLLAYEAGYRQLVTQKIYVDLSVFHNVYNNLTSFGTGALSFESTPPPTHVLLTIPWANGIKGKTDGIEIAPEWKVSPWLELKASYSYLNIDLENKPGNTDTGTVLTDEGSSPRHEGTLQARFNLPKRLEFDPTYRYTSALRQQFPSGLPSDYVTARSNMDVRLSWRPARDFELSMVGQNLFEPHHPEFTGDPGGFVEIRRSFFAKVTWTRE